MEHRLRMMQSSVVVVFDDKFLSNFTKKQSFINILGSYFQGRGHSVIHAEGDADALIDKETLNIAGKTSHCSS